MSRSGDRIHLLEVGLTWPPETFLQSKFRELAERGFRVTVASSGRVQPGFELPGVDLVRLPGSGQRFVRQLAGISWEAAALASSDPKRLRQLVASVRQPPVPPRRSGTVPALKRLRGYLPLARLRPDVVQFEWESAAVHYLPVFDTWGKTPVVVSCRGTGLNVFPYAGGTEHWVRGYETLFRRAAAVHVVSQAMGVEAERFGADPAKIRVVRPGVDPQRFRPPDRPRARSQTFRVLSVGTLLWVKGHQYALQAVRALVDSGVDVRFDVLGGEPGPQMGEASDLPPLNFTVHDLGLAGRVQFHGRVPPSTVSEYMQSADVLLHASVSEGIPTVSIEAMACGLPLVVTDCAGIRETVTDGVEGFVIPKRDPAGMASALVRLWRDPSLREELGRGGRARVLRDFTLSREADDFAELYQAVAVRDRSTGSAA